MRVDGSKVRAFAPVAVACAALLVAAAAGVAGLHRLGTQAEKAARQREAGFSTLMTLAAVRDQVRAQARVANEGSANEGTSGTALPAPLPFERQNDAVQAGIAQLRGPFAAQDVRRVEEAHRDWVNALRFGDRAAAPALEDALLARLERLSRGALAVGREDAAAQAAGRRETRLLAVVLLVAAAAGGIAFALLLARRHAAALRRDLGGDPAELLSVARELARGRFGAAATLASGDGGNLASALKEIALGMQRLVEELGANAAQLSRAADTLVSGSARIAAGSSDQVSAAAGMAASVGQLAASITQVTEQSDMALRISRESGELSEEASGVVASASGELEGVASSARELTGIIQTLGERSGQISNIVGVIRDIANQTNLLALNAAIEAARAGEQGRGFSVVADEVRKLADRTTESTREISEMIASIEQGTAQAVEYMEKWGVSVTGGVSKAQGAGERMQKIRSGTQEVAQAVDRVSGALAEQSSASSDIAAGIERFAAMSLQGSAAAGQVGASARAVAELAAALDTLAAQFRAPLHA